MYIYMHFTYLPTFVHKCFEHATSMGHVVVVPRDAKKPTRKSMIGLNDLLVVRSIPLMGFVHWVLNLHTGFALLLLF